MIGNISASPKLDANPARQQGMGSLRNAEGRGDFGDAIGKADAGLRKKASEEGSQDRESLTVMPQVSPANALSRRLLDESVADTADTADTADGDVRELEAGAKQDEGPISDPAAEAPDTRRGIAIEDSEGRLPGQFAFAATPDPSGYPPRGRHEPQVPSAMRPAGHVFNRDALNSATFLTAPETGARPDAALLPAETGRTDVIPSDGAAARLGPESAGRNAIAAAALLLTRFAGKTPEAGGTRLGGTVAAPVRSAPVPAMSARGVDRDESVAAARPSPKASIVDRFIAMKTDSTAVTGHGQNLAPAPESVRPMALAVAGAFAGQDSSSPGRQISELVSRELGDMALNRIAQGTQSTGDRTVKVLRLQLNPAELGSVTIRLQSVDGELRVAIRADSEQTAQMLGRDGDTIRAALRAAGVVASDVTVAANRSDQNQYQSQENQLRGHGGHQNGTENDRGAKGEGQAHSDHRPGSERRPPDTAASDQPKSGDLPRGGGVFI